MRGRRASEMYKAFIERIKTARVMDYYRGAREYIQKNYISPVKPHSSAATPPVNESTKKVVGGHYSLEIAPYISDYRDTGVESSSRIDKEHETKFSLDDYDSEAVDAAMRGEITERSIADLDAVLDRAAKQPFVDRVIAIIREKGVRDSAVYKAAQIDRRLFSKMMSDRNYKPAKDTAIAIAFALQLPLAEASDLLERAGYTLSHSNKRDIVIEYFFRERMYSLNKINSVLEMLYFKPIGR